MVGGVDKKTLFNEIASSEYFIFPLLTHGKLVYQDTFSLSIAEAIGLGTTVLTYPLGGVPENFGDYCHFIEYPDDTDIKKLSKMRVFEEPKFGSTNKIVSLINTLENNPQLKEEKRKKGVEYIKSTFDISKIGPMWIDFLNKL
jgi:glycosyltransferase involved in cell wall biosynthesis